MGRKAKAQGDGAEGGRARASKEAKGKGFRARGKGSRGKTCRERYDYESAFCNDLKELGDIFIEEMMRNKVGIHYATKTIKSGKVLEVEIYPVFKSAKDIPLPKVKLGGRKAQNDLNDRNSRKRLVRVINCNFGEGDYWMTLTYDDGHCPRTYEEAKKNIRNYVKKVNRRRKRQGLGNAKYIYIIEWDGSGEGTRCHYHLLMEGGIGRDELEDMWKFASVNDTSRLRPNEEGITGLSIYIASKKRGKKWEHLWYPSKNLKKPKESVSHSKTGKRRVERMARDYEEIRAYFEGDPGWAGYQFVDARVMYNKFNCAFYVQIKARERSWENVGRNEAGGSGGCGSPVCRSGGRGDGQDGGPGDGWKGNA